MGPGLSRKLSGSLQPPETPWVLGIWLLAKALLYRVSTQTSPFPRARGETEAWQTRRVSKKPSLLSETVRQGQEGKRPPPSPQSQDPPIPATNQRLYWTAPSHLPPTLAGISAGGASLCGLRQVPSPLCAVFPRRCVVLGLDQISNLTLLPLLTCLCWAEHPRVGP
jgi:hypothetical protein